MDSNIDAVLEDLVRLGFEPVTDWVVKGDKIQLRTLDWKENGGWLYAFVVDGTVKYIGLTDRVLRSRMDDYAHKKNSQTTRLRQNIFTDLNDGRRVEIFGKKESDKKILVDEEGRLCEQHHPPWNRI